MADFKSVAPTPASLNAIRLPFAANTSTRSMPLAQVFMISIGTPHATFSAFSMISSFSAISSGVDFGSPYALLSGSNASASLSISSKNSFAISSASFLHSLISSSTSAYVFFPTVRLPTILPSAIPIAPVKAAAPPPPGTAALLASTSIKSSHVCNLKFLFESSMLYLIS